MAGTSPGGLLLGQVDRGLGLVRRFASCFIDRRDPRYVEHQVETLVGQRIFGLALGYEDLNDHDELRKDPTFAVLAGKLGPVLRSDCEPLAGKSTLNRLEHTPRRHASKYHRIDCDGAQVDALRVELFLEAHQRKPHEIVLDLDNIDIPLHGMQEGRFFHGYYDEFCYLPLYVFCGRPLLLARQRRANVAGCDGAVGEMARIIAQIRQRWPRVHIILRGDRGFANDELMSWCEANRVDYVFGLARNRRVEAALVDQLAEAKRRGIAAGQPARLFRDFQDRTLDSWSRTRRVIGKAEHTLEGANPRFVVTSLKRSRVSYDARALSEDLYCARGEAENRIGEQFELFADRASSATMQAHQLRLWFSAMFWSTRYVASDCATASSPPPRSRPFASSCSGSGRRYEPACAASTSPSRRDARTRPSSNSPISACSAPSARPEPQGRTPRHQTLLIGMPNARTAGLVLRATHARHTTMPRTPYDKAEEPITHRSNCTLTR
jgi:Transposase DDE domain group 1